MLGLARAAIPFWRQAAAVRTLQAAGGRVYCALVGPAWLRSSAVPQISHACDRVLSVTLSLQVSADPLPLLDRIGEFHDLEVLALSDAKVHDEDLWRLSRLTRLRSLTLTGMPLEGAGLAQLAANVRLSALDLSGTDIDDQGLKAVARFANLNELRLDYTRVTDAGLAHLRDLRHLRTLSLSSTSVTETGVAQLTASNPTSLFPTIECDDCECGPLAPGEPCPAHSKVATSAHCGARCHGQTSLKSPSSTSWEQTMRELNGPA